MTDETIESSLAESSPAQRTRDGYTLYMGSRDELNELCGKKDDEIVRLRQTIDELRSRTTGGVTSPDYVMVPREPTKEMSQAGEDLMAETAVRCLKGETEEMEADAADIYRAMIAAAPPSAPSGDNVSTPRDVEMFVGQVIDRPSDKMITVWRLTGDDAGGSYRGHDACDGGNSVMPGALVECSYQGGFIIKVKVIEPLVPLPTSPTPSEHGSSAAAAGKSREDEVCELIWDEILQARSNEDPCKEVVGWEAQTAFNTFYVIEEQTGGWELCHDGAVVSTHEHPDAAKAAAQADHAQRIRSSLRSRLQPAAASEGASPEAVNPAALRAQVIEECAKVIGADEAIFLKHADLAGDPAAAEVLRANAEYAREKAEQIRSLSAVSAIAQEREPSSSEAVNTTPQSIEVGEMVEKAGEFIKFYRDRPTSDEPRSLADMSTREAAELATFIMNFRSLLIALDAERGRMREALRKIAATSYGTESCNSDSENLDIMYEKFRTYQFIARSALPASDEG